MNAYNKLYLSDAQKNLSLAFDYAVNYMDADINGFYRTFVDSIYAKKFESGDPFTISGMSGIELALRVVTENSIPHSTPRIMSAQSGRSPEYWAGWALAYYQWKSGYTFSRIAQFVSAEELILMYSKYHEMDISSFCDRLDELKELRQGISPLKTFRRKSGFSQKELSELSGIPVRTIQQYEQRQKDLKKAQAQYVISLANVLSCQPAELMD